MAEIRNLIRLVKNEGHWFIRFPKAGLSSSLFLEFLQQEQQKFDSLKLNFAVDAAHVHENCFLVSIQGAGEEVLIDALGYILSHLKPVGNDCNCKISDC